MKIRYPVIKTNSLVLSIECIEMDHKTSNVHGLCISILNQMGWYLGVIVKLHNYQFLIYIFTDKFENGTLIIFNKTLYHSWYEEFRNHFSPILINTTHINVHGLVLCIKVDSYVVHMFYAWLFSLNTVVVITINNME